MKVTVEKSDAALAATIDEITNAKAIISLEEHDFADILQDEGELFIIKAEETVTALGYLDAICDAVAKKFNEVIGSSKVHSLVLYISQSKDYPLISADMCNVVNIFHDIELHEVPVKWGVGVNKGDTVKLTIVTKVTKAL